MKSMEAISFNKKYFFRTIILFLILSSAWTILCIRTDEFTSNDKGLITGIGNLFLFAASIYFGQRRMPLNSFGRLVALTLLIFLISSFVLTPLSLFLTTESMIPYALVNSLFVSLAMTKVVDNLYGVRFKRFTIFLTFTVLLIAYLILADFDHDDRYYLKWGLNYRMAMFNIFQFFLIIPLSLGITMNAPTKS